MRKRCITLIVVPIVSLMAVVLLIWRPSRGPEARDSPQESLLKAHAADNPAPDAWFDNDPNHPWNRLRECLFVRTADDGTVYRREELEPPLQALSTHLLEGPSHETRDCCSGRFSPAVAPTSSSATLSNVPFFKGTSGRSLG